jgi:hypothetical protein
VHSLLHLLLRMVRQELPGLDVQVGLYNAECLYHAKAWEGRELPLPTS